MPSKSKQDSVKPAQDSNVIELILDPDLQKIIDGVREAGLDVDQFINACLRLGMAKKLEEA